MDERQQNLTARQEIPKTLRKDLARFYHKTKWMATAIKWRVTAILKRGSYPKKFPHNVAVRNVVSLNCLDEQTNGDNTQDVGINNQPRPIYSGNSLRTSSSRHPRDNTTGDVSLQWPDAKQMVVAVVVSPTAPMQVVELALAAPLNVNEEDFTFTRAVINFEVRDAEENPMQNFAPPLRLYLAYTRADLAAAEGTPYPGGPGWLAFGFLDAQQRKWVTFKEDGFLDEQQRRWVTFEEEEKHHHITLLHAKPGADGIQFDIRQNDEWQSLQAKDGFFHIGDLEIPVAELQDVALVLQGFPDVDGFAFVQVVSWGDPLIGAGRGTIVLGAGDPTIRHNA